MIKLIWHSLGLSWVPENDSRIALTWKYSRPNWEGIHFARHRKNTATNPTSSPLLLVKDLSIMLSYSFLTPASSWSTLSFRALSSNLCFHQPTSSRHFVHSWKDDIHVFVLVPWYSCLSMPNILTFAHPVMHCLALIFHDKPSKHAVPCLALPNPFYSNTKNNSTSI